MKKSIVTYNNIKLTKTTNSIANETSEDTTNNVPKRLIFKSKIQKPIINETKQQNLTNSDSTQVNNKPKIVLKRTLNDKKSDKFNLNNSFDESDDDDFNVFDLNTKTSQLSIKKAKSDTSPSSSSSSSFSPSGQTPPKILKLSPVKTKKIGLKLPESDDEIPKKIEVKKEIKKIALVLPESDEEPVKKPQVKEESKKVVDLQAKLKELDDDEDFDMDLDKIKKFKVIKKSITETAKSENLNQEKKIIIKNKIFNSKTRGNDSEKKLKISTFNINFNENDVKTDEEEVEDEKEELDKKEVKSNLVKANSLQSQTTKRELMPRLLSFDKDRIQDVDASVIMINLRNSRKAYECEELGEAQAFQDDFNYLLDGLNSKYKLSDRCLSSIKLAECCQSSEFRMNLRSSSSNGDSHVEKIFQLLNDSTDFKSLSLCTSLIMFALTQDKLSIDIDKSTFSLILSFLNTNNHTNSIVDFTDSNNTNKFNYLNDLSTRINSPQTNSQTKDFNLNEFNLNDANDDCLVYKKIYLKCKNLYNDLPSLIVQDEMNNLKDEINFNCSLLTLDCLLNMNQNMKRNFILNDFYKNELRDKFVLDKVLIRCQNIIKNLDNLSQHTSFDFVNNDLDDNLKSIFLLNKLKSCINLLETVTQPVNHTTNTTVNNKKTKFKCIKYHDDHENDEENSKTCSQANTLNQNYLIDLKDDFLIEFLNESLELFYDQIDELLIDKQNSKTSPDKNDNKIYDSKLINSYINTLKEYFLFLISLTQNNEYTSSKLSSNKKFINTLFKYLLNDAKKISIINKLNNENDQFDLLIMVLGILLNLLVNCFKQKTTLNIIKYKNKETNQNAFEIILKLYQTKEALVRVAENDQENEFNQLNEQIESQNIENINVAIMNSIHKAGKHMEDHIIAAHSALIIGYMLLNDEILNNKNIIDFKGAKLKLKDSSFKCMTQIIRKFFVFMKMMKVSGFSAEEYVDEVLNFLDKIDV